MNFYETPISSRVVYNGLIVKTRIDTVALENGKQVPREIVEHPGGVAIIPVDDNGGVTLVRQFRYPLMAECLEVPAGKLECGEDHKDCAARELSEETGLSASRLVYLGCTYPSPGFCDEVLHIYLARGLTQGVPNPDEDEILNVEKLSMDDLIDLIMRDEIRDAKTIIAVFKAKIYLNGEVCVNGENSSDR